MLNKTAKNLFCCQIESPEYYIQSAKQKYIQPEDVIYLGRYKFLKIDFIEEICFVSHYLRKQWIFVQNLVLLDNNTPFKEIIQARQDINVGLKSLLQCMNSISECQEERSKKTVLEAVNSIALSVLSLESFEEKILMKLCYSAGQNVNCPISEYFHSYLDINYYILFLRLKCDSPRSSVEEYVVKIMTDMIIMSRRYFTKEFKVENVSFLCSCMKNFWIILKLISEEISVSNIFWDKFKMVLEGDEALFSFWVLKDLLSLQDSSIGNQNTFAPNYNFIKEKLKNFLNNPSNVLNLLKMIYPLVCELWVNENKIEILLLLWEYFSKRLNNSTKYQSGLYISCIEFTEILDTIIFSPKDCDEEFEFFIGMLLNYLKQQPNHWAKIKCRIFSQLSPFKIGDLNEVGMYRVFELFISLLQVNQEELSGKIASVHGNLKEKMITPTNVNIYISFIIRNVRENKDIAKITPPLLKTLQNATEDQKNFHIIKEFFVGFEQVIRLSNDMKLHQWTLLDSWIIKYLATCYLSDLEFSLKILLFLIRKVSEEDSWSYWENNIKTNIYPVLKQIGNSSSCPCIVAELAGEISCLSSDILKDAFHYFNTEGINYKIVQMYLSTVLKQYPVNVSLSPIQEKSAVQSWIRICLCSTRNYTEITSAVMKLESIPDCIKNGMGKAEDPLVNFIEILSSNKNVFLSSPVLSRFCEMCFENLDQYLIIHLPQFKDEMIILRVYTCLALTLLQCGTLLYDRYKASSPVTKLIVCLLFPTEFLIGKISHPFLGAIRKTWHIYFEALLKLNSDNDTYIQRTIRDLISKYLPHFSVSESPLYLCLTRENSAKVVLEKISSIYFKHPTKENELNVTKALKILNEYVKSSTSISLLRIVVTETFFGLCEVYIFHNQRNLALSLIMYIVTCSFYDQLKEQIMASLLVLTEKHLAFNSKDYFNLVNILAKTIPSEILILKGSIVDKIKNIERIRGIGYDDNLRRYLNSLDIALSC